MKGFERDISKKVGSFLLKSKITEFFQKKEVVVKTLEKGFVFRFTDQKLSISFTKAANGGVL